MKLSLKPLTSSINVDGCFPTIRSYGKSDEQKIGFVDYLHNEYEDDWCSLGEYEDVYVFLLVGRI